MRIFRAPEFLGTRSCWRVLAMLVNLLWAARRAMAALPFTGAISNLFAALLLLLRVRHAPRSGACCRSSNLFAAQGWHSRCRPRSSPGAHQTAPVRSAGLTLLSGRLAAVAAASADPPARRQVGRRGTDQHPDDDADRIVWSWFSSTWRCRSRSSRRQSRAPRWALRCARVMLAFLMMNHATQGDSAGHRVLAMENGLFFAATAQPMACRWSSSSESPRRAGRMLISACSSSDPRAVRQPGPEAPRATEGERGVTRSRGARAAARRRLAARSHRRARRGAAGQRRNQPAYAPRCQALTVRVIVDGPQLALEQQFFVDSFNVSWWRLTAFVGFTTSLFSRPYMRIEHEQAG